MATRVTQVEKDLMWELYQKCGSFKEVVSAAEYILNAQNT